MLVCGCNEYGQLGEKSNATSTDGSLDVVCPPLSSRLNVPEIASYSIYDCHAVAIMKNGDALAVGDNSDWRIISSLPKRDFTEFTKFEIKDSKNDKTQYPISAVCGYFYTLYLVSTSKKSDNTRLVYSCKGIENDTPLFLNIGNSKPVSIYGGHQISAAIDSEGAVILIPNYSLLLKSPSMKLNRFHLPNGEKARNIACCDDYLYVLDSSGRVYMSEISKKEINFKLATSLSKVKITKISGVCCHCLAISDDNRVFGCGSNKYGQIGMPKDVDKINEFTEIQILSEYKIVNVFAGNSHSIFQAENGKCFGCGTNGCGQLFGLRPSSPSFQIIEMKLEKSATFFIAGNALSAVFLDNEPLNSPNRQSIISPLELEIERLREENASLKKKIKAASLSSSDLEAENERLREENATLKKKIKAASLSSSDLEAENERLREENATLKKKSKAVSSDLEAENARLREEIASLREENTSIKKKNKMLDDKVKQLTSSDAKKENNLNILTQSEVDALTEIGVVGEGSQSEVKKVTRTESYALKILKIMNNTLKSKPEISVDIKSVKNLLQEYEILHNLHHPNILQAFGFCMGNKTHPPSILLQFCPHSLSEIVSSMSNFEKVCSIYEISLGMEAVHAAGIIHRDLKPANVLIDSNKHVRISDFGISFVLSVKSQTQSMTGGIGTLKFMAPELLNESKRYTNKVDVYSFGVVAFFILSGGEMPNITFAEQVVGKKAKIPSEINDVSRNLISRCWSMKAEDRPSFNEISKFILNNEFKLINGVENDKDKINKFLSC